MGVMRGFDTETVNRPGAGEACLLTTSDGRLLEFPKSFAEIFNFLADGRDQTSRYFAWNMDFDARAIFHEAWLNYSVLEELAVMGRVITKEEIAVEYVPSKFFKARRGHRAFELYDLAQFYGMRLKSAAKKHLDAEEKGDIPADWYGEMDRALIDGRRERVIAYALQDARLVELLGAKLVASFKALGYEPRRWVSPASVSKLVFAGSMRGEPALPLAWQEAFRRSFYGGRIEVRGLGSFGVRRAGDKALRLYDLNSAYPAEIARLVPLRGLLPVRSPGAAWSYNPLAVYGSYRVRVDVPTGWTWGPLALKDGGSDEVLYPVGRFETWCGKAGLDALREFKVPFDVVEAWEYVGFPESPLFPMVPDLYKARRDPVLSLAAKLVMNSWYGKLAEARTKTKLAAFWHTRGVRFHGFHRVRSREVFGRHACFPFAAAITEAVRMKLWRVLHTAGPKAYMAATDSVLLDGELPVGAGLGEWGEKMRVTRASVWGCGRYWLTGWAKGEPAEEFHFRGFAPSRENLIRLRKARGSVCQVKDLRTDSLLSWTRDGGVRDCNVLKTVSLRFELADAKRHFPLGPPTFPQAARTFRASLPWQFDGKPVGGGVVSGYNKPIGVELKRR